MKFSINQNQIKPIATTAMKPDYTTPKGAVISDCKKYRYQLWRTWDASKPKVLFIMLNPSTANADIDDPTIRRCIAFAKSWGFGGLLVGNKFAFRCTDPKDLKTVTDPFGPLNQQMVQMLVENATSTVLAHGNGKLVSQLMKKSTSELNLPRRLAYIALSVDGVPKHPLYLKSNLKLHYFINS